MLCLTEIVRKQLLRIERDVARALGITPDRVTAEVVSGGRREVKIVVRVETV